MKVNDFLKVCDDDMIDVFDKDGDVGELPIETLRKYFGHFKVVNISGDGIGVITLTIEEG